MDPTINLLAHQVKPFDAWYSPTQTSSFKLSPNRPKPTPTKQPHALRLRCGLARPEAIIWANLDAVFNLSHLASPVDPTLSYRHYSGQRRSAMILASDSAAEYLVYRNPTWTFQFTDLTADVNTWTFPPNDVNYVINPSVFQGDLEDKVANLPEVDLAIGGLFLATPRLLAIETILALQSLKTGGDLVLRAHAEYSLANPLFSLVANLFDRVGIIAPYARQEANDRYVVFKTYQPDSDTLESILDQLGAIVAEDLELTTNNPEWTQYIGQTQPEGIAMESYPLKLYGWWAIPSPRNHQLSI